MTAPAYAEPLEATLANWDARLRRGQYRAPPVRRTERAQEDGAQRPSGSPAFEDNMVQRAGGMRLGAMDAQACGDGS